MNRGKYKGKLAKIFGKLALLQPYPTNTGLVLAQFDDLRLPRQYTHGWRVYRAKDFIIKER